MDGDALGIPEAERIDLRMRAPPADERVVFRNRPVRIDAENLAHVAVQLLWLRPVDRVDADAARDGGRHEQRAVGRLNHAADGPFHVQQHTHVLEALVVGRQLRARDERDPGSARQSRHVCAVRQGRVREVHEPVGGKRPIGPGLVDALLAARKQILRQTLDLGYGAVLADDLNVT